MFFRQKYAVLRKILGNFSQKIPLKTFFLADNTMKFAFFLQMCFISSKTNISIENMQKKSGVFHVSMLS